MQDFDGVSVVNGDDGAKTFRSTSKSNPGGKEGALYETVYGVLDRDVQHSSMYWVTSSAWCCDDTRVCGYAWGG